jgi:hypothetical protein
MTTRRGLTSATLDFDQPGAPAAPLDPAAVVRDLVDVAAAGRDPWSALAARARTNGLTPDQVEQIRILFVRAFVERALTVPPRRGTSRHYRRRDRGPA